MINKKTLKMQKLQDKKDKRAFEMSFAWIFAIIVGAIILFFAIYFASKYISTQRNIEQTELARSLGIIVDPLETGAGITQISSVISFSIETRIYNKCYDATSTETFGKQGISMATESGIGKKWQKPGEETFLQNKYLFSNSIEQGKDFYVFSRPFEMPFKVADMLFVYADKYCFVNAPNEIIYDLENVKNIEISEMGIENCSRGSVKVCFFEDDECDAVVSASQIDYSSGYVKKIKEDESNEVVYYSGSLLYAAILSDADVYECNFKRLMARLENLAGLYIKKSNLLQPKCSSGLEGLLADLANTTRNLKDEEKASELLFQIENIAQQIDEANDITTCKMF